MTVRRTNRGVSIDMDALIAASNAQTPAVGNMGVNAKGDTLGPGGVVVKKNEERVREYYQNNPKSSTVKTSLKGEPPSKKSKLDPDDLSSAPTPKTAKTGKENKRTKKKSAPAPEPVVETPVVEEPDEFDAPAEPLGYKEVELPNGDIEMVPYYKSEDSE